MANASNNDEHIVALIPLQIVPHTIVGLTRAQFVSVDDDIYEDFVYFDNMQWDNIEKWISAAR